MATYLLWFNENTVQSILYVPITCNLAQTRTFKMMTLKPFASFGLSTRVRIKEDAKTQERNENGDNQHEKQGTCGDEVLQFS